MISQPTDPNTLKPQPLWSRKAFVISATLVVLMIGWLAGQTILQQVSTFAKDT